MWIATTDGFYSTVRKPDQTDELTVRSRARIDLEKLGKKIGRDVNILENSGTDYPFRIVIAKEVWRDYLKLSAMDITYDNFKATIDPQDYRREDAYFGVWSALFKLE
jgi:hypothetical protein